MSDRPMNKFTWMEAIRGANLTHAEYRVLMNLSTFASGNLTNARPSVQTLCDAACVTRRTLRTSIQTLLELGWIVCTDQGGDGQGRTNVYSLTIPADMGVTHRPPKRDGKGVTHRPPTADKGGDPRPPRGSIDGTEGGRLTTNLGGQSVTPDQEELSGNNTREGHPACYVSNAGASVRERARARRRKCGKSQSAPRS